MSGGEIDRLPQESWVDAATGKVKGEHLGEVNDIIARFYPNRYRQDHNMPGEFQELLDRGEVLLAKDGQAVTGVAGLLFEPSRDRQPALDGSLSRGLWPTQAALPVFDAESIEAYNDLLSRSEAAAREAGKREMLLYEDSIGDSRGAENLLQQGYTLRGVEKEGRHAGKLIFSKDFDNPIQPGKGFGLEDAAKRRGSGWKKGHYNDLNLGHLVSADREQPLTLTYFQDEGEGFPRGSKDTARFSTDSIHDAFSEIVAQGRSLQSVDRLQDKRGRAFSTWSFSASGPRRPEMSDAVNYNLSSHILAVSPPAEILNDLDQDDLEMLYFEAAQGASDLEEERQNLFDARRRVERDLVKRGIEPDEERLANDPGVARACRRIQGALWETEGGWDTYSREFLGRMDAFSLGEEGQQTRNRMRAVREHLDSFKDFFA